MKLADLSATQVIDYYVNEIVQDKGISKAMAKKVLLNALLYNVVIETVEDQIDYLLEASK